MEAGSLGIGTSLVSRAGPALQVTGLTWQKNKAQELAAGSSSASFGGYTVYNLTVDGDHTFFVGTAGGGTWVQNVPNCGIPSRVKEFPGLLRKACDLPQSTFDQISSLLEQFHNGNASPGIGNGNLDGTGIFYLRARNGGRVFLQQGANGPEILGYADKSNESQVINQLLNLFKR